MNSTTDYFRYWGKAKRNEEDSGEPYHLLAYHSLDVAAVAYELLTRNASLRKKLSQLTKLDEKALVQWLVFFIALHDIGKFSDSFQSLAPDALNALQNRVTDRTSSIRHDTLGFHLWKQVLRDVFVEAKIFTVKKTSKRTRTLPHPVDIWIGAVTGHHGEPPKSSMTGFDRCFEGQQDFQAVTQYVNDLIPLLLEDTPFPQCDLGDIKTASWWISGFGVLCDWLGSNQEYFPYRAKEISLTDYWKVTKKLAEKAINKSGLMPCSPTERLTLEDIIQPSKDETIEPTPLQSLAKLFPLKETSQLFILEDVTGAGKTEAAILIAHRLMSSGQAEGVYFALPTMATANAMYSRMAKAYQHFFAPGSTPSLVLAHGAREMSEQFTESVFPRSFSQEKHYGDGTTPAAAHCNQWLADNRKKALLAEIGVGTIDQALLGVLPSRHQSLRLLGMLNKVLVVDEVHACDAYMRSLLCALLKAHAAVGGSAILLTATLPKNQRQELLDAYAKGKQWDLPILEKTGEKDYPLLTALSDQGLTEKVVETRKSVQRTVNVRLINQQSEIETLLEQVIKNGQCVCWIRNTVIDAREAFKNLKDAHPEWQIDLFHARFALGDRLDIEGRVLKRFGKNSTSGQRTGQILIATQVVEQSLDADWDELITDLAPIDSIIQRAGRLQRHTRDINGNRISSEDQRGEPILHVFSPDPVEEPSADWYADFFKKAKKVYANHGQLWLTARQLKLKGKFHMPDDARTLIEGVYSDEAESRIPSSLLDSVYESIGTASAESSLARLNALDIQLGYADESTNRWWDEANTPTRLGEKTTTVYLARWINGELLPWSDESRHTWQQSSVSARTYWINSEAEHLNIPNELIESCKARLPAGGKWGVLVPLVPGDEDYWSGVALNEEGGLVTVSYSNTTGLDVK